VLNSALANGKMAVPNRPEKPFATKHPDFVCIAAVNTLGTGAELSDRCALFHPLVRARRIRDGLS